MNVVCIVGNLTNNPETGSKDGKTYANFTVAVSRNYKNADGQYDADFIPCVAFGGTAEFIAEWFRKGQKIALSGAWRTSSYEDKNGNNRKSNKLAVNNAGFAGARPEEKPAQLYDDYVPVDNSELPF